MIGRRDEKSKYVDVEVHVEGSRMRTLVEYWQWRRGRTVVGRGGWRWYIEAEELGMS